MKYSVRIFCGDAIYLKHFETLLTAEAATISDDAKLQLLIDSPAGWASLEHPGIVYPNCIILSDNLCPSYLLDLLDYKPAALVPLTDASSLSPVLTSVQAGNTLYPRIRETPLSPVERLTLRLVAQGKTNKEIALKREVAERTVKNTLVAIYSKLNLKSRNQALLYYLGYWHYIEGWEKPPFLY